jgi:hypothetical protein
MTPPKNHKPHSNPYYQNRRPKRDTPKMTSIATPKRELAFSEDPLLPELPVVAWVPVLSLDSTVDDGSSWTGKTFCFSILPDPTITSVAIDGTPSTKTYIQVVPGVRMLGFGGGWDTCSVILPSLATV